MLIPRPFKLLIKDGFHNYKDGINLINESFDEYCVKLFLERTGIKINDKSNEKVYLNKLSPYENYSHTIDSFDGVLMIYAISEEDVILGLTSVAQLIQNYGGILPYFNLIDKPHYSHRGLNLDCARHFFPIEEIKKIVDEMSWVKMNVLHWHISDDQGYSLESKVFPKLNNVGKNHYKHEEVRDLIAYAKIRAVKIIPEIDLPGHTTAILSAYPNLSCEKKPIELGTKAGIYPTIMCASNEEVYTFLEKLLGEIASLFPSEYIHIGGDEVPSYSWDNCPDCQNLKKNNPSYTSVQPIFQNRILKILTKLGKKIIYWNDSVTYGFYSNDGIRQQWMDNSTKKLPRNLKKLPTIDSDVYHFYYDYPIALSPLKRSYSYKSPYKNLAGLECCIWTERIDNVEKLEIMLFPRLYALAENAWSIKKNYHSFQNSLLVYLKHNHRVLVEKEELWNPIGSVREFESQKYWNELLSLEMMPPTPGAPKQSKKTMMKFFRYFMTFKDLKLIEEIKNKLTSKEE